MPDKAYLGDGVYVMVDPLGCIVLITEDGYTATNTIYLDEFVVTALINFLTATRNKEAEDGDT
jgi:hypothetical protein